MITTVLAANALKRAGTARRNRHLSRAGGRGKTSGANGYNSANGGLFGDVTGANGQSFTSDFLEIRGIIALAGSVIIWLGACTIFARANPKAGWGKKLAAYIALLFFGDIYLFYFLIRITIANVRGKRDYESLPQPARYFA